MVSGGMTCIKYLLFCFNLLFAISGIAILTVGTIVHLAYSHYHNFLYASYQSAPLVLIVVGVIIFIVAFFGCCGAVKENHCMIVTFSVLLFVILVVELAAGIVGYVKRNEVEHMLEVNLNTTMYKYYSNKDIQESWNIAQHEEVVEIVAYYTTIYKLQLPKESVLPHQGVNVFKAVSLKFEKTTSDVDLSFNLTSRKRIDLECCGLEGPGDWQKITRNDSLPHTCCPNTKPGDCTIKNSNKYTASCFDKLKAVFEKYGSIIGGVGIGIAASQLIGVVFACFLARSIRKEYETV
ncbi:hypothetical protein NQ317_019105 [Molorchus minor]|uniref:Tetraspanin n=1 Tax=Molorchus minor TaxID=1323400 RepID=A0ABQ9JM01_9CUCU|nr:hypothetical protein NQ317_019105 [Molorchus minor]